MPLPSPKKSESNKSEYIHRCMSDPLVSKEFPEPKQRLAVCNSIWEKHNLSDKLEKL